MPGYHVIQPQLLVQEENRLNAKFHRPTCLSVLVLTHNYLSIPLCVFIQLQGKIGGCVALYVFSVRFVAGELVCKMHTFFHFKSICTIFMYLKVDIYVSEL